MSNLTRIQSNMVVDPTSGQKVSDQIGILSSSVYVESFPRNAGETNDTARVQRAINQVVTNGGGRLIFASKVYTISSELLIDVSYVQLEFNYTTIDATAITTGNWLHFTASKTADLQNRRVVYGGLYIHGTQSAGTVALQLDSTNGAICNVTIADISIKNVEKAIKYGNNVYIVTFENVGSSNTNWSIHAPSGLTNAGERMTAFNCTFANTTDGIQHENPNGEFQFINCSFDYFNNNAILQSAGTVKCSNVHFETNVDTYWFYVTGASSGAQDILLSMKQVEFIVQGTQTKGIGYVDSTCLWGGVKLDDYYVKNTNPLPVLIDGVGNVEAKNYSSHPNYQRPPVANSMNLLVNGGFETSNLGEWTSTGSVAPTFDATTKHTGTQSLKFAVTANAQSCTITKDISIKPTQKLHLSVYFSTNFATASNFYGTLTFYDALGNSLANGSQFISQSATVGWTLASLTVIAPMGAIKCTIGFNTGAINTGNNAWIDDCIINVTD